MNINGKNNPMYGKDPWNKGLVGAYSDEYRKKISENHADVSGENNPMFGKRHSKETKDKISNTKIEKGTHIGKKNGRWKGGFPKCIDCGKEIFYGRKRCIKCYTKYNKIRLKSCQNGEDNHNWNNGSSFLPYSSEFNEELKEKIRKRDDYTCQECGKTQEEELSEFNRRLSIHHIDYYKENCKENNLITLCLRCNNCVNKDRVNWMHYFKNKLEKNK